ncbi:MAG: hypothetical protein CVU56_14700 [Deltaproteobacteria bacterium HGW-Deltaproteobacteria-14]|jgi:hypothetical protein|nr:MAG: hypothetical protein CVU56_14700 [Deltaproteobacteria bacterium HGW-Deltaproteobacteria-14]
MVENIEEITVTYEEGGETLVEELDKVVLSRGSWTTILFKYREFDKKTEGMGPIKYTIRRYQKRNGVYRQQSKFNISSVKQGRQLYEALGTWIAEDDSDNQ